MKIKKFYHRNFILFQLLFNVLLILGNSCPLGTFNNGTGLRYANECIPCTPGYYCPSAGLIEPIGECNAGHYCKLASTEASPVAQSYGYRCPVGHYCPQGTPTPIECPKGTYQPSEGRDLWQMRIGVYYLLTICPKMHLLCNIEELYLLVLY